MKWELLTAGVILAAPVLIGVYDLAAFMIAGNRATISRVSLETAREYLGYEASVCFLFGLLCAHLFTPAHGDSPLPPWLSVLLFVLVPVLIAFGTLIAGVRVSDVPALEAATPSYPLVRVLVWLVLGAVVGSAFLPQSR